MQNEYTLKTIKEKLNEVDVKSTIFENRTDEILIVLNSSNPDILYFVFSFIERLVLEIVALQDNADVEISTQGTNKTLISIINSNIDLINDLFEQSIVEELIYFYSPNALRNKLFHVSDINSVSMDDVEKAKILMITLIELYIDIIKKQEKFKVKKIDFL